MSDVAFIILYVENVATSEAFYVRTLGRPAIDSSPGFAMIPAAPGVMLGLWRRDEVKPEASAPGGGEIAFALPDDAAVDAAHAECRDRGVQIAQSPARMDFGYTFVGLDPDGHRFRVFAPQAR
jgi:catechol 2,3-dioxygenase-like lactoylglutathione lyase family enzyme